MRLRKGFTLVELLVVIGIIALLVSILLPALTAARRQAASAKCAAALREIGNAFQMYAIDNKGWYPPSQLQPGSSPALLYGATYVVNGHQWPDGSGAGVYWFNFLSKYVTKKKIGTESANGNETFDQRTSSIMWGCPAWEGYYTGSGAGGGFSRVQPGYGMNGWPTARADYPDPKVAALPPAKESSSAISGGASAVASGFHKQVVWQRNGSQRCIIGDSLFWLIESARSRPDGTFPGQAQLNNGVNGIYDTNGTTIDWYRHGKYPGRGTKAGFFAETGGKVAYNLLYCDGHVATASDRAEAYKATRLRYPDPAP